MGIEPTKPLLAQSFIGFEDRGRHQSDTRFHRGNYTEIVDTPTVGRLWRRRGNRAGQPQPATHVGIDTDVIRQLYGAERWDADARWSRTCDSRPGRCSSRRVPAAGDRGCSASAQRPRQPLDRRDVVLLGQQAAYEVIDPGPLLRLTLDRPCPLGLELGANPT
jgi:hypothetical protein